MSLREKLIKNNEEDMKRINLLLQSLDKLKSEEVAGRIHNVLIDEVMRLSRMNKELEDYTSVANCVTEEKKDEN